MIAITGRGLVSAAGVGLAALRAALAEGRCAIGPLPAPFAGLPERRGGRMPLPLREALLAAAREALAEARLPAGAVVGLALGTALGDCAAASQPPGTDPAVSWRSDQPHALALELAQALGLAGPCATHSATCASGLYAYEEARHALLEGCAQAMLVIAADALSTLVQAGFSALGALSGLEGPLPDDGLLLGGAACATVVELGGTAGGRAIGWLAGIALAADGTHPTAPDVSGAGMRRAIAQVAPGELPAEVYVTASGAPLYRQLYGAALGEAPRRSWEHVTGHALASTAGLGALVALESPAPTLALTVGFGGQNGAALFGAAPPAEVEAPAAPHPVALRTRVMVDRAPDDLEEHFGARWDRRRSLPEVARLLVHAVASAARAAGWWDGDPSGLPLAGGLVVGLDSPPLEAACQLRQALTAGRLPVPARGFMAALPSTPAACCGLALGLLDYQATVVTGGCAGVSALDHARARIAAGGARRLIAAAVSRVGPRTAELLGVPPFERAVACCLERAEPGAPVRLEPAAPPAAGEVEAPRWPDASAGLLGPGPLLIAFDPWLDCAAAVRVVGPLEPATENPRWNDS